MKKMIKTSLSLLSAVTMLTACSSDSFVYPSNPIIGTVPESEIPIPSGLTMDYSDKSDDLEEMKAACGYISFMGEDGKGIENDDVYNIRELSGDTSPERTIIYGLEYDFAYFTYTPSLYNGDPTDDTEVSQNKKAYNEYLLSQAYIYRVKRGDKLENGLICTDARTLYFTSENGSINFIGTDACFSGELTLTGTLHYSEEDPYYGNGSITFTADSKNGNIPCVYRENFFPVTRCLSPSFYLGNISDLPENLASLINGSEYTNVEITIKDINLSHYNNKTDYGSTAVIVDLKVI